MVCGGISEWSVSFAEEAKMAIALSFVATAADKICNIYSMKILNGNFMLGGRGKKVEIDEVMFGNKRKYNCGQVSEGQWVFGMVVRDTGQSLLFSCSRSPTRDLGNPSTARVQWTWHRDHFWQALANHMQRLCSQVKRKLKAMNGTMRAKLPGYLDEFNWSKLHPEANQGDRLNYMFSSGLNKRLL